MNDTPRPRKHPGTSPLWANLPRRKCDDCGKSYKPVRPVKENERGFCTPNCRKSYHKHGGAYRKLKVEMKRMVERRLDELAEQVRQLMEPILDDAVSNIVRREFAAIIEEHRKNAEFTATVSQPGW